MKVFACKRQGGYSGGLIVVAANTKEEAFNLFAHDKRYSWMIDSHSADGEWQDVDDDDAIISSDFYPLEKWYELEMLTANVTEPQIIAQGGHTE